MHTKAEWLNHLECIFHISGDWKSKVKVSQIPGECPSPGVQTATSLLGPHMAESHLSLPLHVNSLIPSRLPHSRNLI